MPTCPSEQIHRWKLRDDGFSYVCVLCDEQRFELTSKSSTPPSFGVVHLDATHREYYSTYHMHNGDVCTVKLKTAKPVDQFTEHRIREAAMYVERHDG